MIQPLAIETVAALAVHDPGRLFPRTHLDALLGIRCSSIEPIAVADWVGDVLADSVPEMLESGHQVMRTAERLAWYYACYSLDAHRM